MQDLTAQQYKTSSIAVYQYRLTDCNLSVITARFFS